ncbi:hypothetical protein E2562_034635 [Oryza meyeriana var. granulata]|uniref:Uncharacterized protein n=1 Tax=Oryza meyeriana var. granulata TaxID=110450 RepID=A0A6G1F1I0_9ORYZ|nr:hypothetical protein E2562_034635 [Oryza meyeriana var. granulata]
MDDGLARYLGGYKLDSHATKPARGTRGGILLLWNSSTLSINDIWLGRFSLTAKVKILHCGMEFLLTAVYGPTRHATPSFATSEG